MPYEGMPSRLNEKFLPNETATITLPLMTAKHVNWMPAAIQYCPCCTVNELPSVAIEPFGSLGLNVISPRITFRNGCSPSSSAEGRLRLCPNPPAMPVMKNHGGPPSGATSDAKINSVASPFL